MLLTAATFVTELEDIFLPTGSNRGTAFTLGIDAEDADGDGLTISAVSDDPNLLVFVPRGNSFGLLTFVESDGDTPIGEILIELFEGRVPENTEQFVALATTGFDENGDVDPEADPFWTDVLVHRVVPDFVIQTGDAESGNGQGGSPLGNFDGKVDPQVLSFAGPGVVAWANSSGPTTNDSQFFNTAKAITFLNPSFAIIGHMISGQDVYDDLINRVQEPGTDRPADPPIMKSVQIIESPQDGSLTVVSLSPANVTTLYDADTDLPPDAPTWVFQETPGPGGETTVRTVDGGSYVFDTTAHEDIQAGHGVNPLSPPLLTLDTDGGYQLDFTFRIDQETHSTSHRAGFSFIAIGSDPTKSLEVAFWDDRVWVYDFDRDAGAGEEDFLHGAEAMLDITTTHEYSLRVENDAFTLLVDGDEALSGPLVDYTGSRPFPAPYDVPNSIVFGDDTTRASGKAEISNVVFRDSLVEGEFDGRAQVTISLDDGTGNITEQTINVLEVGNRPSVTNPGTVIMDPGETTTVTVDITDDLNAPLDVSITTDQEGVELSIEQDEDLPSAYIVTITVPDELLSFAATISALESGLENVESVEPTTQTFTVSTVGAPPTVVDAPDRIDMVPGQSNIFNIEITDDEDAELDVSTESEQEGVTLSVEKISFPNLYQVTIDLPNEHVHFDMNINASEAGLLGDQVEPRTTATIVVSTIGDRPSIEDPGEQRAEPGDTITFTADIQDDTNAPLDVKIESDQDGVTAEIDPETFEVTITLPPEEQMFFDATITVVETAGADILDPTTSTFKVSTLGDLPVIDDTGPVLIDRTAPSVFTALITDDGGLPLDVSVSASNLQVTVEINDETREITITPPNESFFSFDLTVTATELGFIGRVAATQRFAVATGAGVVETDAEDGAQTIINFVAGDRMYVATGTAGLKIFDISDPAAAVLLGEFDTTNAFDVVVVGTTAFVVDANNGLLSLDVSDPGGITQLGLDPFFGVGQRIRVHPDRPDIAYVAGGTSGLLVYDISDPAEIARLATIQNLTGGQFLSNAVWLDFNDDFLFVSDRVGGIEVFAIDDPADPVYVTSFFTFNKPSGIAVDGDRLYITDPDKDRLLIYDVRRPTRSERIANVPIENTPGRVAIFGDVAIVNRKEGYRFLNVSIPDEVFFVEDFNSERGTHPFILDEFIALPVRNAGRIVFINGDDLKKQTVVTKRHTIVDNNGVEVTFRISGPGIVVPTTTEVGSGGIKRLEIFGSTRRTSVTITTDGGDTTLGGVVITGALKKFNAPTTDLDGFFSSNRIVKTLTLDDTRPGSTINVGNSVDFRDTMRVNLDEAEGLAFNFGSPISSFNATSVTDTEEFPSAIMGSSIARMTIDRDFQADVTLSGFFLEKYTLGSFRVRRDLTDSAFDLTGNTRNFRVDGVVSDVSIDVKNEVRSIRFGEVINASVRVDDVLSSVRATRWQDGELSADEIGKLKITGSKEMAGLFGANINARVLKRASIRGNLEGSTINLSQAVDPDRSKTKALGSLKVKGWMMDSELLSMGHLGKLTLGGMRNSRIAAAISDEIETGLPQVAEDFVAEARISSLRIKGIDDEPFSMINFHIAAWVQKSIRLVGVQNINDGMEFGLTAHEIGRLRQSDLADGADPIGGGGPGNDSVVRLV